MWRTNCRAAPALVLIQKLLSRMLLPFIPVQCNTSVPFHEPIHFSVLISTILMPFFQFSFKCYISNVMFESSQMHLSNPYLVRLAQSAELPVFLSTLVTPSTPLHSTATSAIRQSNQRHHFRNRTCLHFSLLVTACHCLSILVSTSHYLSPLVNFCLNFSLLVTACQFLCHTGDFFCRHALPFLLFARNPPIKLM